MHDAIVVPELPLLCVQFTFTLFYLPPTINDYDWLHFYKRENDIT